MFRFLVRHFVRDSENVGDPAVHVRYGVLSGSVGIIANLCLTASKLAIGIVSNSISITADGINNLTDAFSSIVTLLGFKLSGAKPDKEHPFGHGRIEYVAALIVGFIIEMMGFELIKSSIEKIKNPQEIVFSIPAIVVIVFSIAVKLWLALFNRFLGKKISSPALCAAVKDSMSDILATTMTGVSLFVFKFTQINLDGILGVVVAILIMYSGIGVLRQSVGIILGNPPNRQLVNELLETVKNKKGVLGTHDLIIHSYGENRLFGSLDVEVDEKMKLTDAHEIANEIESEIKERFGISLVAHIDPVCTDDKEFEKIKQLVEKAAGQINPSFCVHEFRLVHAKTPKAVFDLTVPFDCKITSKQIKETIEKNCRQMGIEIVASPNIEYGYIG